MTGWIRKLCVGVVLVLAAVTLSAGARQSGTVEPLRIEGVSRPSEDRLLAFTVPGRVDETLAHVGDRVEAGAVLVRLDDEEIAARLAIASARAEDRTSIELAHAALELARAEEQRVREAFAQEGAAGFEIERRALETRRAELTLEAARRRQNEAALEERRLRATLREYRLITPIAGVLEELVIEVGETVEPLRGIARVVVTDPLEVTAFVPTEATLRLRPGDAVGVEVRVGGRTIERDGELTRVAAVADAASGTRRITVRVSNPDGLPAGTSAWLRIGGTQRSSE
jgi:membrane fusion protein, multidrug efflux system